MKGSPGLPSRGEVWLVDLGIPAGHEQGAKRPALILSDNQINQGPSRMVAIVPFTSTIRNIPIHVKVVRGQGGLTKDSAILCDQVRTVSQDRLIKLYGQVSPDVMRAVEDRVKIVLGLR